jgi:hypothetical protein
MNVVACDAHVNEPRPRGRRAGTGNHCGKQEQCRRGSCPLIPIGEKARKVYRFQRSDVRPSSRKAACRSVAPQRCTGNAGSVYSNAKLLWRSARNAAKRRSRELLYCVHVLGLTRSFRLFVLCRQSHFGCRVQQHRGEIPQDLFQLCVAALQFPGLGFAAG